MRFSFLLLALLPLIAGETATATFDFVCDPNSCTFQLAIPKQYVEAVNVTELQDEIDGLAAQIQAVQTLEADTEAQESVFQNVTDELIASTGTQIDSLETEASDLNATASGLEPISNSQNDLAAQLAAAFACFTDGSTNPAYCYNGPTPPPTTAGPTTPTGPSASPGTGTTQSASTREPYTGPTTEPLTTTPYTGSTTTKEYYTTESHTLETSGSTVSVPEGPTSEPAGSSSPVNPGTSTEQPSHSSSAEPETSTGAPEDSGSRSTEKPLTSTDNAPTTVSV